MNGETMVRLLVGVLVGVASTVTMDVLASVSRKLDLAKGAKGQWVGRWYLGIAQGRLVHADITRVPEQPGETRAALDQRFQSDETLSGWHTRPQILSGYSVSSLETKKHMSRDFGIAGLASEKSMQVSQVSARQHLRLDGAGSAGF